MVLLGFVVDLQRLTSSSVEHIKKFLKEVGVKYNGSTLLTSAADMIALLYLTEKDQVTNLAYEPVYGNFDTQKFKKAVKDLPSLARESESEISTEAFEKILNRLYTMGEQIIEKQIVLLTPDLPDFSSTERRNMLMAAKEKCVSCEFVLVNDRGVPHEQIEMLRSRISEIENCSFRLWSNGPVLKETYLKDLAKKIHDTSGDLRFILFPLEKGTVEYCNVEYEVQLERFSDREVAKADVEVIRVYKINSSAVRARLESFPTDENYPHRLLWYPTTFAETHGVVINGFKGANLHKLGMAGYVLQHAIEDQKGNRCLLACNYLVSETNEKHVSPLYLVVCKVSWF